MLRRGLHCYIRIARNRSFPFLQTKDFSMMNNAILLHKEGESHFEFSFNYNDSQLGISRQFNLRRSVDETLGQFSVRIAANVSKIVEKKLRKAAKKKQKQAEAGKAEEMTAATSKEEELVKVQLLSREDSYQPLPPLSTCRDSIFSLPALLKVNEMDFVIEVNPPIVQQLILPKTIMAGFPVYPSPLVLQFAAKENCRFRWFRGSAVDSTQAKSSENPDDWEPVGEGFCYTPKASDIGKHLRLICTPFSGSREGLDKEVVSPAVVEAGPGVCPFETRHLFTTQRYGDEGFRMVTYNILADLYADSDFTRTVLHPYCPAYALAIDYRKQLILKEIIGYNADLICLQEVDTKVFLGDLSPVLESEGFEGLFHRKGGEVNEGLSCFFRRDKFRLVEAESVVLADALQQEPLFLDLWEKVQVNPALSKRITERSTALQVVILDSCANPSQRIVLGNTHLYFHPDADHIRVFQAGMCVRYLQQVVQMQREKCEKNISLLICGDFNSTPEFGVYQLMTTQLIPEDYLDWSSNVEESVSGVSLSHPFLLDSACGTPEYTNYTVGFAGCLDYIYYEKDKLEVVQVVPFPSNEELTQHTALPSVVFPSDHLSVAADLAWRAL